MNVKEFAEWLLATQDHEATVKVVVTKRAGLAFMEYTEAKMVEFDPCEANEENGYNSHFYATDYSGKPEIELDNCDET